MSSNYYEILGINKSASDDEIKKAYRKLAKEYHPDTGAGDPEKMRILNDAYAVLGDPDKRAGYDRPPQPQFHNPFGGGVSFSFGDVNEMFQRMNGMSGMAGGGQNFHFSQQQTFSHTITIPLITAILGDKVETQSPVGNIKFDLPAATRSGTTFKIAIKHDKNSSVFLNLMVNVDMPKNLTEEQKTKLREILK